MHLISRRGSPSAGGRGHLGECDLGPCRRSPVD